MRREFLGECRKALSVPWLSLACICRPFPSLAFLPIPPLAFMETAIPGFPTPPPSPPTCVWFFCLDAIRLLNSDRSKGCKESPTPITKGKIHPVPCFCLLLLLLEARKEMCPTLPFSRVSITPEQDRGSHPSPAELLSNSHWGFWTQRQGPVQRHQGSQSTGSPVSG